MGNIALNKPASASSFVMPYTAANAVNGTLTTFSRWLCNTAPGWMKIDTGTFSFVNRWVVRHLPVAGWALPDYNICDFKLQGSNDNVIWADIDGVTNNTASVTDRTFNPVKFRYFRVYVTKGLRTNIQMISFMEFELYQAWSSLLTNLVISSGTLTPAFISGTYVYTATVTPDVASINVTPTALSPTAVIQVNTVPVASGQPITVPLNFGSNTITVNVTDGGVLQAYTITVTRPASNYLSNLTAQSGTTNIPLAPAFDKGTTAYTATVGIDVTTMTVTPTAENSASTITVNGTAVPSGSASGPITLNLGVNNISIAVTNAGNVRTYTIAVTKIDTSLSGFTLKTPPATSLAYTPTFQSTVLSYSTALVSKPSLIVTPTATLSTSIVKVNGTQITTTVLSVTVTLASGNNVVLITVTNSGVTTTYQVTIPKS